jgi:hypothetical protein
MVIRFNINGICNQGHILISLGYSTASIVNVILMTSSRALLQLVYKLVEPYKTQ